MGLLWTDKNLCYVFNISFYLLYILRRLHRFVHGQVEAATC